MFTLFTQLIAIYKILLYNVYEHYAAGLETEKEQIMNKRILSLLLVAVMMFTMMPITATAVDESETAELTYAEIVELAYGLEEGTSTDVTYTLVGEIVSIDTPYSSSYGNITVTIAVEGKEDRPIMCYRLKGDGADTLAVGDTITVTGILKNYNGTIEFDAGCTLDAVVKGENETPVAPDDPAEIVAEAYALEAGKSLPYTATLTGRIVSVDTEYSSTYGNITVTMVVEGCENYPIMCYRLKGDGADVIGVGDTITVTGTIKNYNGTIEFVSSTIDSYADITITTLELDTVYEVDTLNDGEVTYMFIPEMTEMYSFSASSEYVGSFIYIMNEYDEELAGSDGYNAGFEILLEANHTYIVVVGPAWADDYDTVDVVATVCHGYEEEIITEATCSEAGEKKYTCEFCGDSHTESYLEPHNYVDHVCSVCGAGYPELELDTEDTANIGTDGVTYFTFTPELSHRYFFESFGDYDTVVTLYDSEWNQIGYSDDYGSGNFGLETYLEAGQTYYFEVRFYSYDEGRFPVMLTMLHDYDSEITIEATCTEEGVITYTCVDCDHSYTESYLENHSYTQETTVEATCTSEGLLTYTCIECGDTYTETYSVGHNYDRETTVEATCTSEGLYTYTCVDCGDSFTETYSVPHSYNTDGVCTVCGTVSEYPVIKLDTEYAPSFSTETPEVYYMFVPEVSHEYSLTVNSDNAYLLGVLLDENRNDMGYYADGYNFEVFTYLEAGKAYYFVVASYDAYDGITVEGNVSVTLTMRHNYESEIISEGNCTVPGIVTHTCYDCGHSYTEEVYGDHEYEYEITAEATCSVAGIRTYTCIHCGDSYEAEYYESHDYDANGICSVCDYEAPYPIIELDVEYDTIVEADTIAYYIFIPSESDVYLFRSYTNGDDTQGAISDAYGNIIAFNDDYLMGDFGVEAYLEAGETYYLMVAYYSEEDSGTVPVMLTKSHEYESEVITEATCYVDGLIKETCVHCGETREVTVPKAHEYDYELGLCVKCGGYPSGICGDNLTWTLIDGVLTISGTGDMYDYTLESDDMNDYAPWVWFYESIDTIVIEDGATSIGMLAFAMCANVTSVEIPDSVTSIGAGAFGMCASLTSITIPEGVTEIGMQTFYGCQSLTEVVIPDSVTTIGYAAFAGCESLTEVVIPDSVTEIEDGAFAECPNLTSITFEGDAPTFGEVCFYEVTATAYYPAGNDTWTEDVMLDYGGDITWVEYEPTEIDVLYGDVNLNGEVTAVDAAMAYSYVNGKIDLTDEQFVAGDVNGDGEITAVDAAMIYSYVNGKIDKFPVEG